MRISEARVRLFGIKFMMHYSNWLIGVKNRASLRNACKTPPDSDWNNRGDVIMDMHNNNERTPELTVGTHLWKQGKEAELFHWKQGEDMRCPPLEMLSPQTSWPAAHYSARSALQTHDQVCYCVLRRIIGSICGCQTSSRSFQFPPRVRVQGEGVLRYQGNGQLTGQASRLS